MLVLCVWVPIPRRHLAELLLEGLMGMKLLARLIVRVGQAHQ